MLRGHNTFWKILKKYAKDYPHKKISAKEIQPALDLIKKARDIDKDLEVEKSGKNSFLYQLKEWLRLSELDYLLGDEENDPDSFWTKVRANLKKNLENETYQEVDQALTAILGKDFAGDKEGDPYDLLLELLNNKKKNC